MSRAGRKRSKTGFEWTKTETIKGLGLYHNEIDQLIERGFPANLNENKQGSKWVVDSARATQWLIQDAFKRGCANSTSVDDEDQNEEVLKLRKLAAEAGIAEYKLSELSGDLVKISDLIVRLQPLIIETKAAVQNLGTDLKANTDVDFHVEIDESVDKCLMQIMKLVDAGSYRGRADELGERPPRELGEPVGATATDEVERVGGSLSVPAKEQ